MKKFKKILLFILLLIPTIVFAEESSCAEFRVILDPIWFWIRIAAPVLVIVLGGVDLFKVVVIGESIEKKRDSSTNIKIVLKTLAKRLVIMVLILILPTIINLIIGIAAFDDFTACTDFISPTGSLTNDKDTDLNDEDTDLNGKKEDTRWYNKYKNTEQDR